ncbi:MAG: transglutaminase domain-containing protein [Bacteroidota bacterium]
MSSTKKRTIIMAVTLTLGLASLVLLFYAALKRDEARTSTFLVAYADSSYARAPENAEIAVPKTENGAFLDSILSTIFTNETNLSEEEKSIRILKYVSSVLVAKSNQGSATSILRNGYALCYGKSKVFTILSRKAGLPARFVTTMYVRDLKSHVLSEVFYDGKWHLYDASFGIFFYSSPEYDEQGEVISFHDLVANPYRWTPFIVVPQAGTGSYDESVGSYPVSRVEDERLELSGENISIASYRQGIQKSYPVAYGSNDIVSYPVDANVRQDSSKWFGRVDKSDGELALFHDRFSGSHYVGHAVPPGFHTWLVRAKPFTTVHIEYYSVYSNSPKLSLVPLRAAKIIQHISKPGKDTFTVQVTDSTAIVSVYCPEGNFSVDAMHIYR